MECQHINIETTTFTGKDMKSLIGGKMILLGYCKDCKEFIYLRMYDYKMIRRKYVY